jgi:hypothetical protein
LRNKPLQPRQLSLLGFTSRLFAFAAITASLWLVDAQGADTDLPPEVRADIKADPVLHGIALSCRAAWRVQTGLPGAQTALAQADFPSPWTALSLAHLQAPADSAKPSDAHRPKVGMSIFDH